MAKYLTEAWMAMAAAKGRSLPDRPGASARLQHVVTGGPEGDIRYVTVIEHGATVDQRLGDDPEADVTMTGPYDVSVQIVTGELDASAAYMQGRVKVTGDVGKVMALMPVLQSPEYRAVQDQIRQETEL